MALTALDKGLLFYPGDSYLLGKKIHLLIYLAEHKSTHRNTAIAQLEDLRSINPNDFRLEAEIIQLNHKHQSTTHGIKRLRQIVMTYFLISDDKLLSDFGLPDLMVLIRNIDLITEFRMSTNLTQLILNHWTISSEAMQLIELKLNVIFGEFIADLKNLRENSISTTVKIHANRFYAFSRNWAEILSHDLNGHSLEPQTKTISELLVYSHEILLAEFSRQNAFASAKNDIPFSQVKNLIEETNILDEWCEKCQGAILEGCNNVYKLLNS